MIFIVQFSGGKDSLATLLYVIENYTKKPRVIFNDTGWESVITYKHIKEIEKFTGLKFTILKSKKYKDFIKLCIKKKRVPSTKARFCTEELKINPTIDYLLSLKENCIIFQGIRKDESLARSKLEQKCNYFKNVLENSKYWYRRKEIIKWNNKYTADLQRPVFNWTAKQIFEYIHSKGIKANPLYYEGFKRVGCFPCIMCNHKEIKLIAEKHPEIIIKIKKLEETAKSSFFPIDYIPSQYCKNKYFPMIDDVIKYVSDDKNQLNLFKEKKPSCQSVYNICE